MEYKTKKKIRNFLHSKGGLATIIATALLCVVALVSMMIGYVYSELNGEWNRLGELFKSDFMISIYIILGLLAFVLVILIVLINRRKEKY
jgi:uncharacterized BrkB/YihY/UPF0761 family membrane protein